MTMSGSVKIFVLATGGIAVVRSLIATVIVQQKWGAFQRPSKFLMAGLMVLLFFIARQRNLSDGHRRTHYAQ